MKANNLENSVFSGCLLRFTRYRLVRFGFGTALAIDGWQTQRILFSNFNSEGVSTMASRHEVLCINKSDRTNPHERITHIGGRNGDGTAWKLTQQDAIVGIEGGKWTFYVSRGGRTVNVIVSTSKYGNKYLKTENDGEQPDNLLSLPECR